MSEARVAGGDLSCFAHRAVPGGGAFKKRDLVGGTGSYPPLPSSLQRGLMLILGMGLILSGQSRQEQVVMKERPMPSPARDSAHLKALTRSCRWTRAAGPPEPRAKESLFSLQSTQLRVFGFTGLRQRPVRNRLAGTRSCLALSCGLHSQLQRLN